MEMWTRIKKLASRLSWRFGKPCETIGSDGTDCSPKKTVGVVLDTPNGTRTVEATYGRGARPDFAQVLKIAQARGVVTGAVAVANAGIPSYVLAEWRRIGYAPYCGLGRPDCDDSVTAKALSMGMRCDILVLASGDHAYAPLVRALTRLGKEVVVTAVRESTAQILLSSASEFVDMPVSKHSRKPMRNVARLLKSQDAPQRIQQSAESGA